jgi:hypothetical protein
MQIVSLPENLATPLAEGLRDSQRVESAFNDLQKLIAEKRAALVSWPILTTRSGKHAVFDQIEEFRYWGDSREVQDIEPGLRFLSVPRRSNFSAQCVGVTFEFTPTITEDGQTIVIDATMKTARLRGWTSAWTELDWAAAAVPVGLPQFYVHEPVATTTFRSGERKLLGEFKSPEPAGDVELFIMRVEAMKKAVAAP